MAVRSNKALERPAGFLAWSMTFGHNDDQVQGVQKKGNKIKKKTITKIEHCGAKFYHVHDLGGLDPASSYKKRPKN